MVGIAWQYLLRLLGDAKSSEIKRVEPRLAVVPAVSADVGAAADAGVQVGFLQGERERHGGCELERCDPRGSRRQRNN